MSENSYQNQDLENTNPLRVSMDEATTTTSPTSTPTKKKFALPQDPKIKLLIILFLIVIILFILSLFVTIFRTMNSSPQRAVPTPIPLTTPVPTEVINDTKIPAELKTKFDQVDQNSQININFTPPQIDPDIGL